MKSLWIFLVLALAVVVSAKPEKYTTKFDNIDVDEILRNERLYKKYVDCLLNKGTCTPDGKELKNNIPDALTNNCLKCSEKQQRSTDKVLRFMVEKKPNDYKELEALYDPKKIYRNKYKEDLEKRGIKLPE